MTLEEIKKKIVEGNRPFVKLRYVWAELDATCPMHPTYKYKNDYLVLNFNYGKDGKLIVDFKNLDAVHALASSRGAIPVGTHSENVDWQFALTNGI